jgi:Delta7-sterol 5-desaturase
MSRASPVRTLTLFVLSISAVFTMSLAYENTTTSENVFAFLSDRSTPNPYREFNTLVNDFLLPKYLVDYTKAVFDEELAYYATCYLRDLICGSLVYWVTAGIWHIFIYHVFVEQIFHQKKRPLPTFATMGDQMRLSQVSLLVYAGLPVLSEWLIESKFTRVYFYVDDYGWMFYCIYFIIYIALVELGIYWMHRTLHDNKFLFKYVHGLHHEYRTAMTLTPWASIAFNPLDGILQASPYVFFLLFVPVHYFTHVFMLFFSGVWATNIHDAVWGDSEPIMGAKYHTKHHTYLKCNYGQFFTFCDSYFGTLIVPDRRLLDGDGENLEDTESIQKVPSAKNSKKRI